MSIAFRERSEVFVIETSRPAGYTAAQVRSSSHVYQGNSSATEASPLHTSGHTDDAGPSQGLITDHSERPAMPAVLLPGGLHA